jgi:hypothetical protein
MQYKNRLRSGGAGPVHMGLDGIGTTLSAISSPHHRHILEAGV